MVLDLVISKPITLWEFAKLVCPLRTTAYVRALYIEPETLPPAARRRSEIEVARRWAHLKSWDIKLIEEQQKQYQREAETLHTLAKTRLLPEIGLYVRDALISGPYQISGIGKDGARWGIDRLDVAAMTPCFHDGSNALASPTRRFDDVVIEDLPSPLPTPTNRTDEFSPLGYATLAQAILWIAEKKTPLPLQMEQVRGYPTALDMTDFDRRPAPKYEGVARELVEALLTQKLIAYGHAYRRENGPATLTEERPVPHGQWLWSNIDWLRSALKTGSLNEWRMVRVFMTDLQRTFLAGEEINALAPPTKRFDGVGVENRMILSGEDRVPTPFTPRRGPKGDKTKKLEQRLLAELQDGSITIEYLSGKQAVLAVEYDVARSTFVKARDSAVSLFNSRNSDK